MSSLKELSDALRVWDDNVADLHIIHGVGRSPLDIFKSEEEKELRPLPKTRWELTYWSQSIVHKDWRVLYDSAYYSVPFQFIGETVQICATASLVRIFYNHKEMAYHERAKKKWEYKRKTEHAPPIHENVLQCSREGLLSLADTIGPFTYKVANEILSHKTIDKLRPVRSLLNLTKKYSNKRLEQACQRACAYKMFSYSSIKNILENNLESESEHDVQKIIPLEKFRFARNPEDYKTESFNSKLEDKYPHSKHGNGMYKSIWSTLMADLIIEDEQ